MIHENKNDHGGFRNITIEIDPSKAGQVVNVYGTLKNESGLALTPGPSPIAMEEGRHVSPVGCQIS